MKSIYQGTMKELPEDARPYEKVLRLGAGALSDAELLAIFLRTGTKEKNCVCLAQDILNLTGDGLLGLHDQTPETLQSVPDLAGKTRPGADIQVCPRFLFPGKPCTLFCRRQEY